jgi:hypothetical protein
MATSYARIAGENVPGTEAAAAGTLSTKKVFIPASEVSIPRGFSFLNRDDEMRGSSEAVADIPEMARPTWSVNSRLYPDTLGIGIASMFGLSATGETGATHYTATAGNGIITDPDTVAIPTGATRHVWVSPFGPAGVTPKTAQLNASYKDESVFVEARGCATDTLAITTPEQGGAQLALSGIALYADRVSDPSLTASYETTRPWLQKGLTVVTWLTGSATAADFSVSISNPVVAVGTLSANSGTTGYWPDLIEKDESLVLVTGSISLRHPDPDDMDALKAGTTFATKTRWTSDTLITGSYPFQLWIQHTACQYTGEEIQPLANRRRHDASFNWKAVSAGSASTTITLVNATSSYA